MATSRTCAVRDEYGMRYNFGVTATRFIGVDLAWREGSADLAANETGVAVIDAGRPDPGRWLDTRRPADHALGGHRRWRR